VLQLEQQHLCSSSATAQLQHQRQLLFARFNFSFQLPTSMAATTMAQHNGNLPTWSCADAAPFSFSDLWHSAGACNAASSGSKSSNVTCTQFHPPPAAIRCIVTFNLNVNAAASALRHLHWSSASDAASSAQQHGKHLRFIISASAQRHRQRSSSASATSAFGNLAGAACAWCQSQQHLRNSRRSSSATNALCKFQQLPAISGNLAALLQRHNSMGNSSALQFNSDSIAHVIRIRSFELQRHLSASTASMWTSNNCSTQRSTHIFDAIQLHAS
jgi:hypothetical protein